MEQLIVFRALQGLGAGGLLPIAITIAGDLYQGEERARIQGYISAVWGLAAILGPLVGSVIVARASWPWVFWINLPIGATTAAILGLTLRERPQARAVQIDYLGAALLTAGIAALLLGLMDSGQTGLALVSAGGAGLVLLHVHTPLPLVMAVGALLGLGLGVTSTTFIVVVQTAVGWEQRGVATALQQFCRAIGGTLWVSVQGAALSAAVAHALEEAGMGARLPAVNAVLEPGLRAALPPEELRALAGLLQGGLHQVFVLYLLLALAGLAIVAFLPARPLAAPRAVGGA
jgi:hypothetical protein